MANEAWKAKFPKAMVYHVAMVASNHCLLALILKRSKPQRKRCKRFFFEAMWTREAGCKEVIKGLGSIQRGVGPPYSGTINKVPESASELESISIRQCEQNAEAKTNSVAAARIT